MKNKNKNLRITGRSIALAGLVILGAISCKNKKQVAEVLDQEAAKAQVAQEIIMEESEAKTVDLPRVAVKAPSKTEKLNSFFGTIANSPASSSTNSINQALTMFSNPSAPVLIAIYNEDGTTDYDEPTTIQRYLEYLKDTKNNSAKVEEMVLDENGKIKELVLKK